MEEILTIETMKEIFESIWNAPKEQIAEGINRILIIILIGSILGSILAIFVFRHIKKKMGFGKEWDEK
jgi:uncharacterized membrane protein YsdA (DUF1294 family)